MDRMKYLPIGSIVQLVGEATKVMICGRQQKQGDTEKIFDYVGCGYPEGIVNQNARLFNADEIGFVYYLGYQDIEEIRERMQLLTEVNKMAKENPLVNENSLENEED